VHDEPASGVTERSHHRDLLGLAGHRHTQISTALGPSSGQIGMRQRLALVGEQKHDVAGFHLRFAQSDPQANAIDGVGVLTAFQAVALDRPKKRDSLLHRGPDAGASGELAWRPNAGEIEVRPIFCGGSVASSP
jgi:hypothetical protein